MFAIKQAECAITGVSYTEGENSKIDYVEVRRLNDDGGVGSSIFWSRDKLIHAINAFDIGFVTAMWMPDEPDSLFIGDTVGVVRVEGVEYLRTDANPIPEDDLGDMLPF
jgi:hypothetical protein